MHKVKMMKENWENYEFFYFHVKKTDSYGEDGNVESKVHIIEETDSLIPEMRELNADVFVVTGDHSTPCIMKSHSWHPVPVLLHAKLSRRDAVKEYNDIACIQGGLGRMPMKYLMSVALANAGKLKKFGA